MGKVVDDDTEEIVEATENLGYQCTVVDKDVQTYEVACFDDRKYTKFEIGYNPF